MYDQKDVEDRTSERMHVYEVFGLSREDNIKWYCMASNPVFRVIFQNQGEVFEIYARQIFQSELWGFIEVEEFLFGERSQLLVDPSEEKLKNTFDGVKRTYVPLASIIRIDEVEKEGAAKVTDAPGNGTNVKSFPSMPHLPKRD